MKKFNALAVVSLSIFVLSACGGAAGSQQRGSPSTSSSQVIEPGISSSLALEQSSGTEPIPHAAPGEEAVGAIADFANVLEQAGIDYSEGGAAFEMVNALDGRKFYIADGVAEVYLFDVSSKEYQTVLVSGELPVNFEGAEPLRGVVANKGLVLYCENLPDEATIKTVFKTM